MADEKSNLYDYQAFIAIPREGQQTPALAAQPLSLRPLGLIQARDPDHALLLTAEKWPPPADQEREYSVTLASKWRSKTYRGRATVAVEEITTAEIVEAEPDTPGQASLETEPQPGDSDIEPGAEA